MFDGCPNVYLVPNVEMAASGSRAGGTEVGDDDGGEHAAPPALHDHHAQDLTLCLGHHHLHTVTQHIYSRDTVHRFIFLIVKFLTGGTHPKKHDEKGINTQSTLHTLSLWHSYSVLCGCPKPGYSGSGYSGSGYSKQPDIKSSRIPQFSSVSDVSV